MNDNIPIYFIDTMNLSSPNVMRLFDTSFFHEYCAVIDEICYEFRDNSEYKKIDKVKLPVEDADLEKLIEISDDLITKYKILKLYEGNGDALLISASLKEKEGRKGQLSLAFSARKPFIVTEDRGIKRYCDDHDIAYLSKASFLRIAKASTSQNTELFES